MEFRRPLILCCILLPALAAGCRQNHAARELLERELRLQENRIYELEAELEDAQRALESMRCSTGGGVMTPDRTSTGDRPPVSGSSTFEPPHTILPAPGTPPTNVPKPIGPPTKSDLAPPSVELPAPGATLPAPGAVMPAPGAAPAYQGPPAIVPPRPDVPEGQPGRPTPAAPLPATLSPTTLSPAPLSPAPLSPANPGGGSAPSGTGTFKPMSSPKFLPPSAKTNSVFDAGPPSVRSAAPLAGPSPSNFTSSKSSSASGDALIKSIAVGRASRGVNLDNRPGDDGVQVVVQGRNLRGETVAPLGELSLVLIDPAVPGEGGRYARWDFSADDAAALFRPTNGEAEAGSYFELPWPEAPPAHSKLKLFVRLTTADGAKLQAERDVVVDVTGGTSQFGAPPLFAPASVARATTAPSSAVIPAGAESDGAAEGGLRWGRRGTEAPTPAGSYEMPLPNSPSVEPTPAVGVESNSSEPVEPAVGPLLFPAEAGFGAPETLPQR